MFTSYGVSSRDYLRRARKRLDEDTCEALFYTAFELRCGIEARMQEYLEASREWMGKKKAGWKIPKLAKGLERAFQSGDRIVEMAVFDDAKSLLGRFYFTPVTKALTRSAARLGVYMHAMQQPRRPEASWWDDTREVLEAIYLGLEQATTGTLLGPPMWYPKRRDMFVQIELIDQFGKGGIRDIIFGPPGTARRMEIKYHVVLPIDSQAHSELGAD